MISLNKTTNHTRPRPRQPQTIHHYQTPRTHTSPPSSCALSPSPGSPAGGVVHRKFSDSHDGEGRRPDGSCSRVMSLLMKRYQLGAGALSRCAWGRMIQRYRVTHTIPVLSGCGWANNCWNGSASTSLMGLFHPCPRARWPGDWRPRLQSGLVLLSSVPRAGLARSHASVPPAKRATGCLWLLILDLDKMAKG